MSTRFMSLAIALLLAGCGRGQAPPVVPSPLPVTGPAPEVEVVPRIHHGVEERAAVWVYPVAAAPWGNELLADKARALTGPSPSPVAMAQLPAPNRLEDARHLAQAGAGYVVIPHFETGPAGFLTLELYRPPAPELLWVTSVPLTRTEEVATAMDQGLHRLTRQMARFVREPDWRLVAMTDGPRIASPVWALQTGAFLDETNARDAMARLRQKGYDPYLVTFQDNMEHRWHAVRLGRHPTRERALAAMATFQQRENWPVLITPGHRKGEER